MNLQQKINLYKEMIEMHIERKIENFICVFCLSKSKFDAKTNRMNCTTRICRKRSSLFKVTCMQGDNDAILEALMVADLWLRGGRVVCLSSFYNININRITSYIADFGQVLKLMVDEISEQIGGENIVVEIDESKFGKRKYNRRHRVVGSWVVGLVERTSSRKIILIPVIRRDKITLHDIVNKYVKKGSIIMSDGWKGYRGLDQHGYKHYIINHTIVYQRSEDDLSIHTNTMEGNWRLIKELCPSRYRNTILIFPYLNLYILKRYYAENIVEIFINKLLLL